MKRENVKLIAVLVLILTLIIFSTANEFFNKPVFNNEDTIENSERFEKETVAEVSENIEMETILLAAEETESEPDAAFEFTDGIMLCDIDGDGSPEKFELTKGDVCTATMNGTSFELCDMYMDDVYYGSFFSGHPNFLAVVQHKITGRRALVCSILSGYYDDVFNIVTIDKDKVTVTDSSASTFPVNTNSSRVRDIVLKDYVFLDEKIYISLDSNNYADAIEEYRNINKPITYGNSEDGRVPCYLKKFDLDNRELEYIPLPVITYDEYVKAKEEGFYILDGVKYELGYQASDWAPDAYLLSEDGEQYWFYEPWEGYPAAIIAYNKRNPIKVKMSDDFKVRYGVTGYDENGIASGFDEFGNMIDCGAIENRAAYTAEEYFESFYSLNFAGDKYITIENGEAVYFDDWYHD